MKSVARNYIYNLFYQILNIILPLVTTPYLSRTLGAGGIGTYSYVISVTTYFVLFGSLGMSLYGQRQVAYVQNDLSKRSRVFFETFLLRVMSLLVSIVLFIFIFAREGDYSLYYRTLLIYLVSGMFDISYFFQGTEDFKKIIGRNLLIKIISIACVFLFVKTPNHVGLYLLIFALSNLIGNLSLWLYLPMYIEIPRPFNINIAQHIKPALALFIPQIATQIYTVLDKVMLGTMLTEKAEVGLYEQSHKIVLIVLTVVTSLGTVMLPNMASKYANNNKKEITESLKTSFRFVFMIGFPMMLGICAIAGDLIPKFLGEGFERSVTITYAISPIILFIGLSNIIGMQYLLPTMRQRQYTISVALGAAVNLICNLILIPKFKAAGAAIATVAAEAVVTGVQLLFVRKEIQMRKLMPMAIKYVVFSVIMFAAVVFSNKTFLLNRPQVARVFVDVFIGIVVYGIMLVISKDKFIFKTAKKILEKDE